MKPLVWLPLDHRHLGDGPQAIPYLFLGEKYASAIKRSALAQPCTFPLASEGDIVDLLEQVDGVVLPGSPANIDPRYFQQSVTDPSLPLDPRRDALRLHSFVRAFRSGCQSWGSVAGFKK